MTIIIHVSFTSDNFFDIYDATNACCRCLLCHACVFFALMLVLRSGIKLGWIIYLAVHPNEVMSGRLVNTCSAGYRNCTYCIDTCLTFPALSCASQTLSEISYKFQS